MVDTVLALPRHLLQEVGQAGTAALPMLEAAQGLHTAEGLGWGWYRLQRDKEVDKKWEQCKKKKR